MSKQIDIDEVITDKNSDYNIKIFKLGGLKINEPLKTIDAKNTAEEHFKQLSKGFKNILFETSNTVKSTTIDNILNNSNDDDVKKKFGYKKWQYDFDSLISTTFEFNPYTEYNKIDEMAGYFDYYYNFSKTGLLIPNIKVKKNEYKIGKKNRLIKTGEKSIIDFKNYIRYIEDVFEIFDHKNHKQIFVPLSLKFDISDIGKLAEYYMKKEYFNIWVDFEGATSTDLTKLSKLKTFNRIIDNSKNQKNVVIYSTNIRREITSNKKNDISPASDILTSLNGSNIIGVNREPQGFGDGTKLTKAERDELRKHKSRVFDEDSYYYVKTTSLNQDVESQQNLLNSKYNILYNSSLLTNELNIQKEEFLKNHNIKEYINDKKMINEYKDGFLKRVLFQQGKTTSLSEYSIPL